MSSLITLIPNDTTLIIPKEFLRSEDISIISIIDLDCIQSLSFIAQWLITNCTLSCESEINNDSSIKNTKSELFIPARTLSYGVYQLKLIIKMNMSSILLSSKFVYIKIIPSNIIVNLFLFGTSFITNNYRNDLVLNPGLYSINPDLIAFDFNVSFSRKELICIKLILCIELEL